MSKPNSLIHQLILEAEFEVERMIGLVENDGCAASSELVHGLIQARQLVPFVFRSRTYIRRADCAWGVPGRRARIFPPRPRAAVSTFDSICLDRHGRSRGVGRSFCGASYRRLYRQLVAFTTWALGSAATADPGALRYRPAVQIWATLWLVLGLGVSVLTLGFDPQGPTSGAGQRVDHLLWIVPTVVRGILLSLTGLHRGSRNVALESTAAASGNEPPAAQISRAFCQMRLHPYSIPIRSRLGGRVAASRSRYSSSTYATQQLSPSSWTRRGYPCSWHPFAGGCSMRQPQPAVSSTS